MPRAYQRLNFAWRYLPVAAAVLAWLAVAEFVQAGDANGYEEVARPFLQQHCVGCHGAKKALAGFRIDQLGVDFSVARVGDQWKEVLDRLHAGAMPPEGRPRPDSKQIAAFAGWVEQQLREVTLAANNAGGRIPMRRLNRDEYANTIRDLLKLDDKIVRPLCEDLPGDGKAEGFDRLGVALFFDQTQIERSLAVAEKIAARAIVTQPPPTSKIVNRFDLLRKRPPPDRVEVFPGFTHTIPRGAQDRIVRPDAIEYIQGYPTYRREYDGWGAIDHFSIARLTTQDGYYRFRIKAKVDNRGRTTPNKFRLQYAMDSAFQAEQEVEVDPSGLTEAVMFLRGGVGDEVRGPQVFRLLWNHTEKAVINEPKYKALFSKWTALRGQMEQAAAKRVPQAEMDALKKRRGELEAEMNAWQGVMYIYNPEMDLEKLPRLLIEWIEVEGPVQKEWPPPSHKALLFAGDDRRDGAYIREVFARFLPRAYRRPVTPDEVEAIVQVVENAQKSSNLGFHEALRIGLQRVLCAPAFLFLQEPAGKDVRPRPLNDYELASRLSYFLWSTMPDEELFALAAAGKLKDKDVVAGQVRRLLSDPRAEEFVRNFAGQWLSVREYGSMQPAAEYKNYDKLLEAASKQEPLAFFTEVLSKNLPITNFLDSDFVVINERLAKHYGIDGVIGPEFRRVALKSAHHRGGVLGMAGLMTLLADGTRTLPLRRATWVMRELFNDPPNNPPPNAGEIQPNTAGKNLTVRQRLDLHRRDTVCASCHARLDPYGLALENYDAIGQWRERFNGEGFRGSNAPLLDVSGSLADGTKFRTLEEYKAALVKQKDKFARAFTIKLLTYALCRPVGYPDHERVTALTAALQQDDYRIQTLIQGIAASDAFLTK
jgi:mono/diheme cytochrome c family protein